MLPTTVWNTMLPMLSGTNVISRTTVWSSITPTNTGISRSLCIALNNYQFNLQYFVYMELKNFQMFNVHNYINSTFLLYQLNSFGSNMILFCFMFFKVFFSKLLVFEYRYQICVYSIYHILSCTCTCIFWFIIQNLQQLFKNVHVEQNVLPVNIALKRKAGK